MVEGNLVEYRNPGIALPAVIPYPDEEAGEVPKGVIVLKEPVAAKTILEFVAERVAPHKRIRQIEFVDKKTEIAVRKDPAPGAGRHGEGEA